MDVIWLIWGVVGGSVLLAFAAVVAALWQFYLRRDVQAKCDERQAELLRMCQQQLHWQQQVLELRAGLRAEKAHVEQLKRQLELLRLES